MNYEERGNILIDIFKTHIFVLFLIPSHFVNYYIIYVATEQETKKKNETRNKILNFLFKFSVDVIYMSFTFNIICICSFFIKIDSIIFRFDFNSKLDFVV